MIGNREGVVTRRIRNHYFGDAKIPGNVRLINQHVAEIVLEPLKLESTKPQLVGRLEETDSRHSSEEFDGNVIFLSEVTRQAA